MNNLKIQSFIQEHPLLRRLIQPKRIPLLFSVTIVAGIFYHYAPKLTWLWIILALVIQALLFRLFDFVKKHPLIGGIAYVMTGALFLAAAFGLIRLGFDTPLLAPEDPRKQLDFLVWFLTPQSVLTTGSYENGAAEVVSTSLRLLSTEYLGYTLALFLLFTMFIATTAYYFSLVRYRVLMSFVVMIFPFAIYAKESETMPVLSIIILLVCYFAVMIYCRQAHGEDSEVVQKYEPNAVSRLSMPKKKSAYAKVKPEILDGSFFNATGIFMAAATIVVLMLPKPEVEADRAIFDSLLDFSALSDTLMDAISAFTESSDGDNLDLMNYSRTLFYTQADEPLNLRLRSLSNYHYDTDSWTASDYDRMPMQNNPDYVQMDHFKTLAETADPAQIVSAVQMLAKQNPDFSAKYGLEALAALPETDAAPYYHLLTVQSATFGKFSAFPAPLHVRSAEIYNYLKDRVAAFMTPCGVLFRYSDTMYIGETYKLEYLSEHFAAADAAQALMKATNSEEWSYMLADALLLSAADSPENAVLQAAFRDLTKASIFASERAAESETPERVRALALQLTDGLDSDYEKAMAIRDYLRFSDEFVYSLDFHPADTDNIETFLFENKIGICKQYAGAMTELGRAAGLNVRYIEGYSMSEPDKRLFGDSESDYIITTDHGHAFVDVYIAGYGWMMLDPTSGNILQNEKKKVNVLATLQYSGLILFFVALVLLIMLIWIVPVAREKLFRRKFRRKPDAASVAEAFARLRKQWNADPAETARSLCTEKSAFLQLDLQPLLSGFESAVYAERCDAETADSAYRVYCAAYDAWKPACKRHRREERAARKKARTKTA